MKKINRDMLERMGWTLAQCALAFITTELADAPLAVAPIIASVLSLAKGLVKARLDG